MPSTATSANEPSIARTPAASPPSTRRRASSTSTLWSWFRPGIEQVDDAFDGRRIRAL